MDKKEQIKEIHDCSNCRFSKQVAPYKVILECELDMETKIQPQTCNRWEGLLYPVKPPKEKPRFSLGFVDE